MGAGLAYPHAKGFGQLLNLNCAIMVLPVFRKGVRYLHDISSRKGSSFFWIPYELPLDKNIVFHKVLYSIGTHAGWGGWYACWVGGAQRHTRPQLRRTGVRGLL